MNIKVLFLSVNLEWKCEDCTTNQVEKSLVVRNLQESPTESTVTTETILTSKQNIRIAIEFEDNIVSQLNRPDLASALIRNILFILNKFRKLI